MPHPDGIILARKLGLPMSEVCRQAKVHPTTFSRWKKSEKNPDPIGASIKTLSALDVALTKFEKRKAAPTSKVAA